MVPAPRQFDEEARVPGKKRKGEEDEAALHTPGWLVGKLGQFTHGIPWLTWKLLGFMDVQSP